MRSLVGPDEVTDVPEQFIVSLGGGIDELVDGLEHSHLAEQINLRHREGRIHGSAARRSGQAVAQFKWIVARGEQCAMTNLGMTRLVPCHASEIILRLEIFEADVPDERAE